jgi:hypothetical protein
MNYTSLEEQESPALIVDKAASYSVQATASDAPKLASTPSQMQGIDSLPKETFPKARLPSNPHLPIVNIKPYTEPSP